MPTLALPWFPPGFDPAAWTITVLGARQTSGHHVDLVLAALADLQHGVVAWAQLRALGITEGQIRARLRSGHLIRRRPGVYAVGRAGVSPPGRRMAMVLAAGHGARLAGWSGCTQRSVLPPAGRLVDIAIPPDRRVRLLGTAIRRVAVTEAEVSLADGIPTHSMARLLLDLAVHEDADVLEWAWRQANYMKVLDIRDVARLLGDHHGAAGTPVLRALYERRAVLAGELRNRFELLMLSVIREAGLPEPLCNVPLQVRPGVVLHPDFCFPGLCLIVESDGRDGHADVEFLLTDDERDAAYAALGYGTLRYSWWEARRERTRVVGELRRCDHAQGGRGAHGGPRGGGWPATRNITAREQRRSSAGRPTRAPAEHHRA